MTSRRMRILPADLGGRSLRLTRLGGRRTSLGREVGAGVVIGASTTASTGPVEERSLMVVNEDEIDEEFSKLIISVSAVDMMGRPVKPISNESVD